MPERYVEYGRLWTELNPEAELHDWTEEEIFDEDWLNKPVLDDLYSKSKQHNADLTAYYTHVADVIDYELPYLYGGWYFNTDLKPIRPLSELPEYSLEFPAFAYEDDVHLVNMAMYGPIHDRFFEYIITKLPERYFGMPGAFMNATTGVQLIMECVSMWPGLVQRFHRDVYNPIHWSQFGYGEQPNTDIEYPSNTVAVHEWLHRTNQRGQRVIES